MKKTITDYENPADFWYALAKEERQNQKYHYYLTSLQEKITFHSYGFCNYCRTEDIKVMSVEGVSLCGGCIRKMFSGEYKAYTE